MPLSHGRSRRPHSSGPDGFLAWSVTAGSQPHTEAACAPVTRRTGEHSGDLRAAVLAGAGVSELPASELIPIPFDHTYAALRAPGAAAFTVVHVTGVDEMQSIRERDATCAAERRGWGRRLVEHLPVGMERREVQRHIRPELLRNPLRHLIDLAVRVVLAGYEQCRDLEPHPGFVLQVLECLEDGGELASTHLVIEALGEPLEIDIGRVHVAIELGARLWTHVAGGDGDAPDPRLPAGLRRIDRILHEYDRVVVRESDAGAPEPAGGCREIFRARAVGERVHLARLRHVPILTKF